MGNSSLVRGRPRATTETAFVEGSGGSVSIKERKTAVLIRLSTKIKDLDEQI